MALALVFGLPWDLLLSYNAWCLNSLQSYVRRILTPLLVSVLTPMEMRFRNYTFREDDYSSEMRVWILISRNQSMSLAVVKAKTMEVYSLLSLGYCHTKGILGIFLLSCQYTKAVGCVWRPVSWKYTASRASLLLSKDIYLWIYCAWMSRWSRNGRMYQGMTNTVDVQSRNIWRCEVYPCLWSKLEVIVCNV